VRKEGIPQLYGEQEFGGPKSVFGRPNRPAFANNKEKV
jgi:hypothetical protein